MKLSYNWLKEYIDFKVKPSTLANILTNHVVEIDSFKDLSQGLKNVVVGEIKKIKSHPQSKKLKLVWVLTKLPQEKSLKELKIVCGADNIAPGQKVPLALPGAVIFNQEIKKRSILGIVSEGMLCAEDELGIGDDHSGIFILPSQAKPGESIINLLGLKDTIFEIENSSLAHRPDLYNHLGFVREIKAFLKESKLKKDIPSVEKDVLAGQPQDLRIRKINQSLKKKKFQDLDIQIQAKDLCFLYLGVKIDGVKIEPSPLWLRNRLRNLGFRPINNIVDITNYVLLKTGQPLHAFDWEKVKGGKIIIRRAKDKERILLLNEQTYQLDNHDLVIADAKRAIALAGIMGGEKSGVSSTTKTILVESAIFSPICIRRTSQKLGLRTEASLRFEKGLPLNFAGDGLIQAIEMIEELAKGKVSSLIVKRLGKTQKPSLKSIKLNPDRINVFLNVNIPKNQVVKILTSLGFKVEQKQKALIVRPPIFRKDIKLEEDLIEEVGRIYGFNRIKPQPINGSFEVPEFNKELYLEDSLKDLLKGIGFYETPGYVFSTKQKALKVQALELSNPLNSNQRYLRVEIVKSLERNIEKNKKRFKRFRIFEIGKVFLKDSEGIFEKKRLGGIIVGEDNLFFKAKGIVESILDACWVDKNKIQFKDFFEAKPKAWVNKTLFGSQAVIFVDKEVLGILGEYKDEENKYGYFELDISVLLKVQNKRKQYQPISRYEPVKRDLAFLIDKSISCQEIERTVEQINPLIKQVEIFDVFAHPRFGDKRNIAFHIIYQAKDRTLRAEEIDNIQRKIINILEVKFKAKLRDF